MPYSPEDIVAYEFRLKARGYDRDEVDRFLDELADQVEQTATAQDALRSELADLKTQLAEARESEMALKRTLVIVQDASERAMAETQEEVAKLREKVATELSDLRRRTAEEAEETISQAESQARDIVESAERSAAEQRERVAALQQIDADHRRRLREHLDAQLEALHELPDPFSALTAELAEAAPSQPEDGEPTPSQVEVDGPTPSHDDPWRLSEPDEGLEAERPEHRGEGKGSSDDEDEQQRESSDSPMWS